MVSPDRIAAMKTAIMGGDLKKVQLLLKSGVPAGLVYDEGSGKTLAGLAATYGQFEVFRELMTKGATYTLPAGRPSWAPKSLLMMAATAERASVDIIKMILENGKPTQQELDDALLYCGSADPEIVSLLLDAGASPTYSGPEGQTALLHAVVNKQSANALLLFAAGARLDVRVPAGFDPELYKKTIIEVAQIHNMDSFLNAIEADQSFAKPQKITRPTTIRSCWSTLGKLLAKHGVNKTFPPGNKSSVLDLHVTKQKSTKELRELWEIHNGSDGFALIPMPMDISYHLLSLDDAVNEKIMVTNVYEGEQAAGLVDESGRWWQPSWFPFAANGAGDFLVVDCDSSAIRGAVLSYNHETRAIQSRAPSLVSLFQEIITGIDNGRYHYHPDHGLS